PYPSIETLTGYFCDPFCAFSLWAIIFAVFWKRSRCCPGLNLHRAIIFAVFRKGSRCRRGLNPLQATIFAVFRKGSCCRRGLNPLQAIIFAVSRKGSCCRRGLNLHRDRRWQLLWSRLQQLCQLSDAWMVKQLGERQVVMKLLTDHRSHLQVQ